MKSLDQLAALLPDGRLTTEPEALRHAARDHWALAMLRDSAGASPSLPIAVAFAESTDEAASVLRWASERHVAVVPRGAASGVVGGAQPEAGSLVLDLSRANRILEIDDVARAVHAQAGVTGRDLEAALEGHGLTTGHYPQSIETSTVGGWIAASSAGQASVGYGTIEDRVLGVTAVLAGGEVLRLKAVPRSAAGPDLRRLLIGSEGTLAVITEAVLACEARPPSLIWDAFAFPSFEACIVGLRDTYRAGAGAVVIRGYDEPDAMFAFGSLGHPGGSVAIVGSASDLPGLADRRAAVRARVEDAGASVLPGDYGEHWWTHRNDAAGLYEAIMGAERVFGSGIVVDTMEVAGLWGAVPVLYDRVGAALAAHAETVGCHLSHLYGSGSSLYFTFLIRGRDDREAEAKYLAAWDDAVHQCLQAGGTITHHHGVGRLKVPYLGEELSPAGVGVLRAIKRALDPDGILNPGALLG